MCLTPLLPPALLARGAPPAPLYLYSKPQTTLNPYILNHPKPYTTLKHPEHPKPDTFAEQAEQAEWSNLESGPTQNRYAQLP